MNLTKKILSLLTIYSILFCASAAGAYAATIYAASTSYSDVSAAVSSAYPGDTVVVPAGNSTWNSTLTISDSITLIGQTSGCPDSCDGGTYITGSGSGAMIYVTVSGDKEIDISGFTLDANNSNPQGFRIRNTDPSNPLYNLRIHHNEIKETTFAGIEQATGSEDVFGLIDNNKLTGNYKYDFAIYGTDDARPWNTWVGITYVGTKHYLYIEDNKSTGNPYYPIASGRASRWVGRYNTIEISGYAGIDVHGDTKNYGVVAAEIYENTIAGTYGTFRFVDFRGGTGIIFNNEISSNISSPGINYREEDSVCDDPNHPESLRINNTYSWNNTKNGSVISHWESDPYNCIAEDVNYWDDYGDSNFTKGLSSARPGSCSDDDCYWETDTRKLYRCIGANNWSFIYTPYNYPHPLQGPSAPKNLTIK